MPPRSVKEGPKRARQVEHIAGLLLERGESEGVENDVAARTVDEERARVSESRDASRPSPVGISSARRGGPRSHDGPRRRTRGQLDEQARRAGERGRARMAKAELLDALGESA